NEQSKLLFKRTPEPKCNASGFTTSKKFSIFSGTNPLPGMIVNDVFFVRSTNAANWDEASVALSASPEVKIVLILSYFKIVSDYYINSSKELTTQLTLTTNHL